MQRRLISVILFAMLAAGLSSMLLYRLISNSTGASKPATTRVFVASKDLEAGSMVTAADLHSVDWPGADGGHWIRNQSEVVGRSVLTTVAKDEPFAESRLAAKGAGGGIAARIPPGMRMIGVHVDELTGLSRFISPGMHVDVISTGGSNGSQGMVSRTILQNIEVFSSGQSVERDAKDKVATVPIFNLLVTPQQAMTLSQAVAQTRIELVLRNPLDKITELPAIVEDKLRTIPPPQAVERIFRPSPIPADRPVIAAVVPVANPPPPPPILPPVPTVEVIQGTKRTISPVAATAPGFK